MRVNHEIDPKLTFAPLESYEYSAFEVTRAWVRCLRCVGLLAFAKVAFTPVGEGGNGYIVQNVDNVILFARKSCTGTFVGE